MNIVQLLSATEKLMPSEVIKPARYGHTKKPVQNRENRICEKCGGKFSTVMVKPNTLCKVCTIESETTIS